MGFMPKNILITGGAGFIGSNMILYLMRHYPKLNIVNLDKLTYAADLSSLALVADQPHYHFIHGDIADAYLVGQVLEEFAIDAVIHFAAESHVDRSIDSPGHFVQTNVVGTYQLLECVRNYFQKQFNLHPDECRFHHISTDEVYGSLSLDAPSVNEISPYQPRSPYSASKAASDHFVQAYYHTFGLPVTITNCSNNYGPHQHMEKLIPTIIRCCYQRNPIPIYGDGLYVRDWLYVQDHCEAIWRVVTEGVNGECYNVGGGCELSNLQLVNIICNFMDERYPQFAPHAELITFVQDRPGHDRRYSVDTAKIANELEFTPQTSLQIGLGRTIDCYLERLSELECAGEI